MYKDVWKKILAAVLSLCMVIALIQLPDFTVKAEEGKTYYDYRHSGNGVSSTVSSKRAAAIFQSGQSQGDEYIESALFDIFVSEEADLSAVKATVSLYLNPDGSIPDSGTFVCSSEIFELTEGTNSLSFNLEDAKVSAGETFAVIVALEGEGISFYADEGSEAGKTFAANDDGSWLDLVTAGQCANICVKTSKIEPETEENGIIAAAAALFSNAKETLAPGSAENEPQETETTEPQEDAVTEATEAMPTESEEQDNSLMVPDSDKTTEAGAGASTDTTNDGTESDKNSTGKPGISGLGGSARASATVLPNRDIQIPLGTTNTVRLNDPVSGEVYNWVSDDNSVASVESGINGEAVITANGIGQTMIRVSDASNTFSDACKVTVVKNLGADSVTITIKDPDIIYDGSEKRPEIEVMDGMDPLVKDTHYTLDYFNNTDAGDSAKVVISGIGAYGGIKEQLFTISAQGVTGLDITWDAAYADGIFPWTGNPADVSAGIIVTDTQRNEQLIFETDYELVYPTEDDHITEGNHTVIVRGLNGKYTGDKNVTYTIQADINSDLEIRMADGTVFQEDYTYTGYDIKPAIQVLYKGAVLTDQTDYTVSYSANCKYVTDSPSLTVIAKGSYTGTSTVNYNIIPKNISEQDNTISAVVITPDDLVAARGNDTVTPVLPPFEAIYNGKDMAIGTDYEIDTATYSFLNGNDWGDATSVSVNINGINNFIGFRTLVYTIGSDLVLDLGSINQIADEYYTGSEIEPAITFSNATSLQEDVDYTVAYSKNVNAGTATVKVKGKNGHGGELTQTFNILPKALNQLDPSCFSYGTPVPYVPGSTGITTELEITYNGKILKEEESYTAIYSNNLAVTTTAKITLNPGSDGNFTGTTDLFYEIGKCNIYNNPNITISGIDRSYVYTGSPIEPVPVVTYGTSNTLSLSTDYDLIYSSDHTGHGTASVTVRGKGNYTGSIVIKYEITDIPIENVILDYQIDSTDVQGYNGVYLTLKKHTGRAVVLDTNLVFYRDRADQAANRPLVQDRDYKLHYTNNTDISTSNKLATVTLEGMGNYSGKKTFSFLIGKELNSNWPDFPAISEKEYIGEPITISNLGITDGWFKTLTEGQDYKVTYSDNESVGTANVVIKGTEVPTVNGCYTGSISRTFEIKPRALDDAAVSVQIKDQPFKGAAVEIPAGKEDEEITAVLTSPDSGNQKTLAFNTDYTILAGSYNHNDTKGTASVVLVGDGNFKGQRLVEFEVAGKSIKDSTIKVTIAPGAGTNGAWLYNRGTAIVPLVKVEDTASNYVLVANSDYQIKYSGNINAGTAKIKITGQGNYSDFRDESFVIEPLSISDSTEYKVSGLTASGQYTYTGYEIKPIPTISYVYNGATTKLKTGDYKVEYKYNTNVSDAQSAEMIITGDVNYCGSQTVPFTITAKNIGDNDIKIEDIPPQASTGGKVCPAVKITYGTYTLTDNDFSPEYFDNVMNGTAKIEITGKGNFSGTANTTFDICTPLDDTTFEITYLGASSYTYTGGPITPEVEVKSIDTGRKLTQGIDYQLDYDNHIDASTSEYPASVTVKGMGNYAGDKKFDFLITKKNIADSDVTAALEKNSYVYTGLKIEPTVDHVTYNRKNLLTGSAGNDYTVAYGANLNVGVSSGIVVIDASDSKNYSGTKTLQFDITARSIGAGNTFASGFSMEDIPVQGATGAEVRPVPVVKYKVSSTDIRTLVTSDDFTLSYSANVVPGTANITITGCNNYSGSVMKTFKIGNNIEGAVVNGINVSYDYAGSQICPSPTSVTLNGMTLTENTDYTVTFGTNDDVGMGEVIITGNGTYGGSITKTFKILGNIADATVERIDDVPFTGNPVYPLPVIKWKERTLVKDTDYTLAYDLNTNMGTAKITITGAGYFKLSTKQEVTFEIVSSTGRFIIEDIQDQNYCGEEIKPLVSVSCDGNALREDTDYKVYYYSNTNAGSATVLVQGINGYVSVADATKTFEILKLNIGDMVLKDRQDTNGVGGIVEREYTGMRINPAPDISLSYQKDGNTIYTLKGSDYTLECEDKTGVGPVAVTIKASEVNFTGTRTEYFTIKARNINDVSISELTNYPYTGGAITPKVILRNGTILMQSDLDAPDNPDYRISYESNVDAGTAVIHLLGVGNYTGDKDVNFTISKMDLGSTNVSIKEIPLQFYTGEKIEPDVTVVFKDMNGVEHELDPNSDFKVEYGGNNIDKGINKATVLVIGQGKNFTGSKPTTFSIAERDIGSDEVIVEEIPNQAYTGSDITPPVTIKLGNYTLELNKDYDAHYTANTELGTANVEIVGTGNFTGTKNTTFEIANGIDNAVITEGLNTNYTYTGSPIEPKDLTVSIGSTKLVENTDYTISYKEHTDAGTASLILTGDGVYGGSKTFTFTIDRKKITDSDVVLTGFVDNVSFAGVPVTQDVTLTYGAIALKEKTDYVVKYYQNTTVGQAQMQIIGLNVNYEGTINKNFTIGKKLISDSDVQVTDYSSVYTYTGEAIQPVPTVMVDGEKLKPGYDYKISYGENKNAGDGKIVLQGDGIYGGERTIDFKIVKKSIMLCSFSGVESQVYTGNDLKPGVSVSDAGKQLALGKDYLLSYKNNQMAGTGYVIIAGKNNYTVTKNIKFQIVPGGVKSVAVNSTTASSLGLQWTAEGVATGYEIYRDGGDGRFTRVARNRNMSYNDEKLTGGTTYRYKVRAYLVVDNETYYSAFSDVVTGRTN